MSGCARGRGLGSLSPTVTGGSSALTIRGVRKITTSESSERLPRTPKRRPATGSRDNAPAEAFQAARQQAAGLQFLAVQSSEQQPGFDGFWILRDLPDG